MFHDGSGNALALIQRSLGKNDNHFFATIPGNNITGPAGSMEQYCSYLPQDLITGLMAICIVITFETIKIHQAEGKRPLLPPAPLPFFLQFLLHVAPVMEAGQRIAVGKEIELAVGSEGVGNVVRDFPVW